MVIFFTETDLVSFGNYMLSPDRKAYIIKESINDSTDVVNERLNTVLQADLQRWINISQKSEL